MNNPQEIIDYMVENPLPQDTGLITNLRAYTIGDIYKKDNIYKIVNDIADTHICFDVIDMTNINENQRQKEFLKPQAMDSIIKTYEYNGNVEDYDLGNHNVDNMSYKIGYFINILLPNIHFDDKCRKEIDMEILKKIKEIVDKDGEENEI